MRSVMVALLVASFFACSGASPESGQSAFMRVRNAQYLPGTIDTAPAATVPEVHSISTLNNDLFVGITGKSISGTVGPGSTAVLIGLLGDGGHWVVPVQDQDQNTPGDFTFGCSISFSARTPADDAGGVTLVIRATNRNGDVGPAILQPMTLEKAEPQGELVIRLDWDDESDLDLHVVLPADADAGTNEIWSRKPSGLAVGAASGATVDDGMAAGYLDFDSNSQCAIDGRRVENVIFPASAPAGHYIVRVDTFSLCSETTARWRLQVFAHGAAEPTVVRYGQSTESDTRFSHGQGAGVTAVEFDYEP